MGKLKIINVVESKPRIKISRISTEKLIKYNEFKKDSKNKPR